MKKLFYVIIALTALAISSCRKSVDNLNIKQFDDLQIQNYIAQNHLTGMIRDTSGGDTTGIYYQILDQGTGPALNYPDVVSYTYTYRTFDGGYSTTDTIVNHTNTYVGHVVPNALQISIKNIAKRRGAKVRLLIPSRLAFGTDGYFSGGVAINGNQCLDYTIYIINNQPAYDNLSIRNAMVANGLDSTTYTKTASGLWYKIIVPGTGPDAISLASTAGVQYTGTLLNGTAFDTETNTNADAQVSFTLYDVVPGFAEALTHTTAGGQISFFIPSHLAYGDPSNTSGTTTIPAFSCLHFELTVYSVSN